MDSFVCSKKVVLAIADYQASFKKGFEGESEAVRSYIASMPDFFGYESSMTRVPSFVSGKLSAHSGTFVRPFLERMRHYKRGLDWKALHKGPAPEALFLATKSIPPGKTDPLHGKTVLCNGHKCGMQFYNKSTGMHEPCSHSQPHKSKYGCSWEGCAYALGENRSCEEHDLPKVRIVYDETGD